MEDANEEWLGDFATNFGIGTLRDFALPSLTRFLDEGEADEDLVEKIIEEVEGVSDLQYIGQMLRRAKPPVFVTDGTQDVDFPEKSERVD